MNNINSTYTVTRQWICGATILLTATVEEEHIIVTIVGRNFDQEIDKKIMYVPTEQNPDIRKIDQADNGSTVNNTIKDKL